MARFDVVDIVMVPERAVLFDEFADYLKQHGVMSARKAYARMQRISDRDGLGGHPLTLILASDYDKAEPALLMASLELYLQKNNTSIRADDFFGRGPYYSGWRSPASYVMEFEEGEGGEPRMNTIRKQNAFLGIVQKLHAQGERMQARYLLQRNVVADGVASSGKLIDMMIHTEVEMRDGGAITPDGVLELLDEKYWGRHAREELDLVAEYLRSRVAGYSNKFNTLTAGGDSKRARADMVGDMLHDYLGALDLVERNRCMRVTPDQLTLDRLHPDKGAPKPDDGESGPV